LHLSGGETQVDDSLAPAYATDYYWIFNAAIERSAMTLRPSMIVPIAKTAKPA